MSKLVWDKAGEKTYETGVDHGVLFIWDPTLNSNAGGWGTGIPWNGLTGVTESPSGAEATAFWADNIKYLNLMSAEDFGATIEAYTYPEEFGACDGSKEIAPGVYIGQQSRQKFCFCYRTRFGNDLLGDDYSEKIHIIYNCLAAPSEKGYQTVNDSPELITFSWTISTTPEEVGTIDGVEYKPTAHLEIERSQAKTAGQTDHYQDLLDYLYGTDGTGGAAGTNAQLPTPAQVYSLITTGSAA